MSQTYRVRYSLKASGQHQINTDVVTIDVEGDLECIPGCLPAGAYIMYVEDLTAGRDVHWTRWPKSYRPGFGPDRTVCEPSSASHESRRDRDSTGDRTRPGPI